MGRYRFRRPLAQGLTLTEALEDAQWDYLMRGVHPTHGPRLRRGTVTFIRHSTRSWGWAPRARPRFKRMRASWRHDRERPRLRRD